MGKATARGKGRRPVVVQGSVATRGEPTRRSGPGQAEAGLSRRKAEIFRALGQVVRLRIIEVLSESEHTVSQLARLVGTSQSNLSKHLALLRRVGLVGTRREGANIFYGLKLRCTGHFLACVTEALREQSAEAEALARRL